ncbi:MAG: hypothetical protein PUF81_03225 [Lachnospiraceae bacterium]|nr:hypothetical protein [Lachnospiraceae bacterium]MDY4894248.1 hypothetical protein [Agathobacter sp.]
MKKMLFSNYKFTEMDDESVSAINTFIGVNIPVSGEGGYVQIFLCSGRRLRQPAWCPEAWHFCGRIEKNMAEAGCRQNAAE